MKHRAPRKKHRSLKLVVMPAVVGAALVGGFAAAAFTMSGSVEADGKVATPTSPTATAQIATLWPGECADVTVTFANANDRPVVIDGIRGSITQQPGAGAHDRHQDQGPGNDLVGWRGDPDALDGRQVPADGSATFTIPGAVCLSTRADGSVQGDDVAATITFDSHIPDGTQYHG